MPPQEPNPQPTISRWDWLTYPALIWLVSRLLVIFSGYSARAALLPNIDPGPWQHFVTNLFLDTLSRWDSSYYASIARSGYDFGPDNPGNVAFFPLYPLQMRGISQLFGIRPPTAGIIISHICLFGALVMLYLLTRHEFGESATARRAVLYIAVFPTAFFFSAVYTESLFLLLAVTTIYFARTNRWLLAGLVGLLATATRINALFLLPFVGLIWLQQHGWHWRNVTQATSWRALGGQLRQDGATLLSLVFIPFGLFAYMGYLAVTFDDPLAFVHAQANWGRTGLSNPLAPIWQAITEVAIAAQNGALVQGVPHLWRAALDAAAAILGLALVIPVWRRLGSGYGIYVLLSVLLSPASGGTAQSLLRYVLVIFPLFMLLAHWGRRPALNAIITITFATLMGACMAIFANWGFVG